MDPVFCLQTSRSPFTICIWFGATFAKYFLNWNQGTVEILRHHRTAKHLLRDQRGRYEHLKSVNLVTSKNLHQVRGRNGKILSKRELAKEIPKFIHVELVDIGERFSFQEGFGKGSKAALVTPESRASKLMGANQFLYRPSEWGRKKRTVSIVFKWASVCGNSWIEDFDVPFQVMIQNYFNCAMEDIAEQMAAEQGFSVEFEDFGTNRFKSLRWSNRFYGEEQRNAESASAAVGPRPPS